MFRKLEVLAIMHLVHIKYCNEKSMGFFFFFLLFRPAQLLYVSSRARGQIGAAAVGHSHSYTRSFTHWRRPGIRPASSQTLCQLSHNGSSQAWALTLLRPWYEPPRCSLALGSCVFIHFCCNFCFSVGKRLITNLYWWLWGGRLKVHIWCLADMS